MSEVYHTLQKKHEFKEQNTWGKITSSQIYKQYLESEQIANCLLWVYGFGGTGKSYMVKRWMENESKEKASVFFAYLDLSDCGDESDVYYRIASELKKYYETYEKSNVKREKINTLLKMYEWVKGIYREDIKYTENVGDLTDKIGEFIRNEIKNQNKDLEEYDTIASQILLKLAGVIPFVKNLKWIIETVIDVKDITNGIKLKKSLLNVISELESSVLREKYLLDMLKCAMPENTKRVIILDNFQLNLDNELGRNHQWLSQEGKLLTEVSAFWVITSRRYEEGLFTKIFDNFIMSFKVCGFSQQMAEAYLMENCFLATEKKSDEKECENKLVKAMLNACYYGDKDGSEKVYMPYLLRLIVLYYWSVKEDATRQITPDLFVKLERQEGFVGYYFYKDLSDLMINAFQILSCLSTWDDVWIDKVREKFDNHLLNAKNLLRKKASIEELSGGGFKLHEALKEALYYNQQNYIKQDVLEFLYQSFIEIYDKTWKQQKNSLWADLNRIQTYIEIVFEYIELQDNIERKKRVWEIKNAVANIYAANKDRGMVSERFIYIYSIYIDELSKQLELSFNNISKRTFKDDDIHKPLYNGKVCDDKSRSILYYISCCFHLADLYTNIDQYEIAKTIEYLCLEFWKTQKHLAIEGGEWYYRCWQQEIKALNAIAYDSSAMHDYEEAFEKGSKGLYELQMLGFSLCDKIGNDKLEIRTLFDDENWIKMDFTSGVLDKKKKIYCCMVEAYKNLQKLKKDDEAKENGYISILYELVFVLQQNLRGNYPWYCLQTSKFLLPTQKADEKIDNDTKSVATKSYLFGIYTYWMRQAICEALKDENADKVNECNKKMLTSYHNICVYLFKGGQVEAACFLEREVLTEMKNLVGEGKLNNNAAIFIDKLRKGEVDEFPKLLWKQQNLNVETGKKFFSQDSKILEAMQYLGDYYLDLKLYSYAYKYLKQVMLYRVVCLGKTDTKTLDTTIRLLLASYGNGDLQVELSIYIDNLLVEQEMRGDGYVYVSKGVGEKLKLLKQLKDMINNDKNIQEILEKLKKQKNKLSGGKL